VGANGKRLGPNKKALDPNARDHIDARAPKDRKQADLLKKGAAAIDNQDWPTALELLQVVLGQEEDSVDRFGKEGWLSLRERALRLILKLPDEVVRTFRQRWSVEAQRRLEEAEQSGRADQIARVATRFFLTDAGHAAADRLGTRHLDRGESALATRWFRLLADAHAPITTDRRWQIKAAMAAKLAGQQELAERWWKGDGSQAATEQIEVGGETMRVSDW